MTMKPLGTFFLAAAFLAALPGCEWLKDWPRDRDDGPPEPQMRVMQAADGTWMQPVPGQPPVERRIPEDPEREQAERIKALEAQVERLRRDMATMAAGRCDPQSPAYDQASCGAPQPRPRQPQPQPLAPAVTTE